MEAIKSMNKQDWINAACGAGAGFFAASALVDVRALAAVDPFAVGVQGVVALAAFAVGVQGVVSLCDEFKTAVFFGSAIVSAGLTVAAWTSIIDMREHTNAPCEDVVEITDNTIHIQKPLPVGCTLAPY